MDTPDSPAPAPAPEKRLGMASTTLFVLSLLLCIGSWGLIAAIGADRDLGLWMVPAWGLAWLGMLGLYLRWPQTMPNRPQMIWIILIALAVRLLVIAHPEAPDLPQAIWNSELWLQVEPAAEGDTRRAWDGPARIWFGAALNWLALPLIACKLVIIGFDLIASALLLLYLQKRRLPLRQALLYALNPVPIYAFAALGIPESPVAFLLLLLLLLHDANRPAAAAFCLAGIVLYQPLWGLCVPLFLVWNLAAALPAIITCGLLYHWHIGSYQALALLKHGSKPDLGLALMPIWAPLWLWLEEEGAVILASLAILGILLLWGWIRLLRRRRERDPADAVLLGLGAMLLCAPELPWGWLACLLPFAALRLRASALLASLGCAGLLLHLPLYQGYDHPNPAAMITYAIMWTPLFIALLREGWLAIRQSPRPTPTGDGTTSSAVRHRIE